MACSLSVKKSRNTKTRGQFPRKCRFSETSLTWPTKPGVLPRNEAVVDLPTLGCVVVRTQETIKLGVRLSSIEVACLVPVRSSGC